MTTSKWIWLAAVWISATTAAEKLARNTGDAWVYRPGHLQTRRKVRGRSDDGRLEAFHLTGSLMHKRSNSLQHTIEALIIAYNLFRKVRSL